MAPKTTTTKTTTRPNHSQPRPEPLADAQPDVGVDLEVGGPPHPLSDEELQLLTGTLSESGDTAVSSVAGPAPTMTPPGATTSGPPDSAGTAITGQKVVATYAEQSNRNAWAYLSTAGWKKLSDLTDTGSTTMTLLAAHARATGSAPYADENPAGKIGTLYVW